MDEFSYLSVLLSIILGLAVTEVLQGFRRLLQSRARVRLYWPTITWAFLLFVIYVQSWWAMFGLREHHDWTFRGVCHRARSDHHALHVGEPCAAGLPQQ